MWSILKFSHAIPRLSLPGWYCSKTDYMYLGLGMECSIAVRKPILKFLVEYCSERPQFQTQSGVEWTGAEWSFAVRDHSLGLKVEWCRMKYCSEKPYFGTQSAVEWSGAEWSLAMKEPILDLEVEWRIFALKPSLGWYWSKSHFGTWNGLDWSGRKLTGVVNCNEITHFGTWEALCQNSYIYNESASYQMMEETLLQKISEKTDKFSQFHIFLMWDLKICRERRCEVEFGIQESVWL